MDNYVSYMQCNYYGQTLEFSTLRCRSDVLDLLQSPQWPILLRQSWEKTTPFRELIKKMPSKLVI